MKNHNAPAKIRLEGLRVKSFVTGGEVKGGIGGPTGAYTCITYCTTGPSHNNLCSNPCTGLAC